MKTLDLNQMENLTGGNRCSNAGNLANALGGSFWAVGALAVTNPFTLALWLGSGAALALAYYACI